jgi:hypothetical protein
MPKQIRFIDYDENTIVAYINPQNNVFISINKEKLHDEHMQYVCLSKEDLEDFIEHLNNLHKHL